MEPPTDPQRYAKYEFARELAERLEEAVHAHRFERLVLVAAPKTLGDLRELLPDPVKSQGRGRDRQGSDQGAAARPAQAPRTRCSSS